MGETKKEPQTLITRKDSVCDRDTKPVESTD